MASNKFEKELEKSIKAVVKWLRLVMYQPEDVEGKSQKVRFYLGGPEENLDYLVKSFRSVYKNAKIIEQTMEHISFSRNKLFGGAVGGRMRLQTKKSYHLLNIKLIN